jgi:5-methylcytosine-specific restriction endonuclease McrBC regulatory subunit McrC
MNLKPDDIQCFELGSDEPSWVGAIDLVSTEDCEALQRLQRDGIITCELNSETVQVSGADRVGIVVLPSGRRLVIRSKIANLVLLEWLAYLGEFPPLQMWLANSAVTTGMDFHACIARLFLHEIEKVSRLHLRKDYTPVVSLEPTIRGRIITNQLYRRLNRLPHVPQRHRLRTFDTSYNIVLALALDKTPMLLAAASQADQTLLARQRDLWAHIRRDIDDPISAVTETQWACPPGYRAALQLARLILIGAALDPESGVGGQAFTLSLDSIWERSLRRMVENASISKDWISSPDSARTRQWDDSSARWLTADIMAERDDQRWILDAKYKRLFGKESRADRFQMCAYAVAFDADRVTLLYPTAGGQSPNERVLLDTFVGPKRIVIDSVDLPMASGPTDCERAVRKLFDGWYGNTGEIADSLVGGEVV